MFYSSDYIPSWVQRHRLYDSHPTVQWMQCVLERADDEPFYLWTDFKLGINAKRVCSVCIENLVHSHTNPIQFMIIALHCHVTTILDPDRRSWELCHVSSWLILGQRTYIMSEDVVSPIRGMCGSQTASGDSLSVNEKATSPLSIQTLSIIHQCTPTHQCNTRQIKLKCTYGITQILNQQTPNKMTTMTMTALEPITWS